MENDFEKIKIICPACTSEQIKFSFKKNDFKLHRCLICNHLFIYPLSYDAQSLYNSDYFVGAKKGLGYVDYDKDKKPMRPVFIKYLKKIEKILHKKGTLLDVGAATGFFIKIAKEFGWNVKGLEISKYASGVAKKNGLDVYCGTLKNSNFTAQSFNIITMWDVLEHFADPQTDISIATHLLKPNGIIVINTPNSGSLYARIMKKRWHLLVPPEHINYFTKKSITLLLVKNGFSIVNITNVGKSFTLEYIAQIAATWQKSNLLQKLTELLKQYPKIGQLSIPINLFDNMFIIAQKK